MPAAVVSSPREFGIRGLRDQELWCARGVCTIQRAALGLSPNQSQITQTTKQYVLGTEMKVCPAELNNRNEKDYQAKVKGNAQ